MERSFPQVILYGADYNHEQWPESTWLDDMRLMKLAHVNMVSINIFSWAMLEPQPDHYRFDQLDRIMDLLAEHEIAADLATATATLKTSIVASTAGRAMNTLARNSCHMVSGAMRSS